MEKYIYTPKGVCSRKYEFILDKDLIIDVIITGGCDGNLKGISQLLKNKKISEITTAFTGIKCGFRQTSCPDQIAIALKQYAEEKNLCIE